MSDKDETPGLPPDLRFLKSLVTILTGVMVAGLITVVALLVTRLPGAAVSVPGELDLPDGTEVHAVTQTPSYWLVTTDDDRVLLFGRDGRLRGTMSLPSAD